MLTLQIFAPAAGLKSPSPFCLKAIAMLEMSGLAYRLAPADPRKIPNRKLPVLIDGDRVVPDSSHIAAHLREVHGIDPDEALTAGQLAVAQAFRRLMEEHLYWVMVYSRWIDKADAARESFFGPVPPLMRGFVFAMVARQIRSALDGQGMGRHTRDQIYAFGIADLQAIADSLGDKDFFFGNDPALTDTTLYGFLANILVPPFETPLKTAAQGHENLTAYLRRFEKRFGRVAG